MFSPDFKEFVALLIENKAEYLIVGGYAVGIHGYPRYTGDLDIWLHPSVENANRILKCLTDFGFASINLGLQDFIKEGNVIQLGYPPLRIDLLTSIDGVSFGDAYRNRKKVDIDGLSVDFIGYDALLINKAASGRLRDLDDIDHLK